jgi:hypothetical protein
MSSDVFGRTLGKVSEGLAQLVHINKRPTPGSPADNEVDASQSLEMERTSCP